MSFGDDETGVETSLPREFYEVTHGATSYYVASGDRDITYNGHLFVATPSSRMDLAVSPLTATFELVLVLPANHDLSRRYVALGGVPPRLVTVVARRLQVTSGEVQQFRSGVVTSVAFEGHLAKFRVPSRTAASLDRMLPSVLFDSTCANVLYDGWCQVSRASFAVTTTASDVDGRVVTVASIGGHPDDWAKYGELLHVASGERMTISSQVGAQVTMQYPIFELHSGDAVQVFAGCDHLVGTCNSKFANKDNFAGAPQRPTKDIFLPTGLGVEEYR